jgi:TctA family transporter
MELFGGLWLGLQTALTPTNMLYCLIGVFAVR